MVGDALFVFSPFWPSGLSPLSSRMGKSIGDGEWDVLVVLVWKTHTLLLSTFHWPECCHMTAPDHKECWEMSNFLVQVEKGKGFLTNLLISNSIV